MFATYPRERVIVLVARGELDLAAAPATRHHFDVAAIGQWSVVVVDLAGVPFIDVAGCRPFREAAVTFSRLGKRLFLLNPVPPVERLLRLAGLGDAIVPLEQLPYADELVDALGSPGAEPRPA